MPLSKKMAEYHRLQVLCNHADSAKIAKVEVLLIVFWCMSIQTKKPDTKGAGF